MSARSDDVLESLVRVSFTVTALLSQAAAEHDLSLTQLRALAILRDREPKMAELAGYLGLDRSSVSGLIDRAARRGLVRRTTSTEDGRAIHVSLTPAGQGLAAQLTAEIGELIAPMMSGLTSADQRRLNALLTTLLG
jgi:DNA-binding MarR family transcriptional regulator